MNIIGGRCRSAEALGEYSRLAILVMDLQVQAFYNGVTAPAAGITNVGNWTGLFVVHFLLPCSSSSLSLLKLQSHEYRKWRPSNTASARSS